MNESKRKEPRFTARFDGFYRLKNSTKWLECYIYDISESGASLSIKQILLRSDQLEICLNKEDRSNVIIGVVANVSNHVVGIKFISKNAQDIIDAAIERAKDKSKFIK